MHVPDGFLDAVTSTATGVLAIGGVAAALRGTKRELSERTTPLVGLCATFVFAAQMVNFPVGAGTSGHLIGGALAAVLVGPWSAILCMSVVIIVQSLLFADGGITALGTNITLMGLVSVAVGWACVVVLRRALLRSIRWLPVVAGISAWASVVAASAAFTGLYALGGTVPLPMSKVLVAMVGWHAVIGLGEAVITGLVVASVLSTRPDLVYAARPLIAARTLEIRTGATS